VEGLPLQFMCRKIFHGVPQNTAAVMGGLVLLGQERILRAVPGRGVAGTAAAIERMSGR
jgi:hypothetical protein